MWRLLIGLSVCCGLLFLPSCQAPEPVVRAEIQCAVIFDSVSAAFRDWVETLPADTPERLAAKTEMLRLIDLRRAEYRSLHEQLRAYLGTDEFVKSLEAAEPILKEYLDWLLRRV